MVAMAPFIKIGYLRLGVFLTSLVFDLVIRVKYTHMHGHCNYIH